MRLQDHTIDETRKAMEEAFRYAKAVPEDKLDWKPMDTGQSVLSMAKELAKCPDWATDLVQGKPMDFSEESQAASMAEMDGWKTLDDCERACQEKLGTLFAALKEVPDARLGETMDLPFGPGGSMKPFTIAEMADYPRWNFTYHLGQIGYIQTLYGDKAMH